eukprot:849398-Pyramimonas_sp.AAC.1
MVGPPPAKLPRVEGDLAASPLTQPPAKLGGKVTAGSQPWKPTNVFDAPPVDQSHQGAAPQYTSAPRGARRRGDS